MVLRNVVPRQGTETMFSVLESYISLIEKCSSPTGDGNSLARLIDLQSASDNSEGRRETHFVARL